MGLGKQIGVIRQIGAPLLFVVGCIDRSLREIQIVSIFVNFLAPVFQQYHHKIISICTTMVKKFVWYFIGSLNFCACVKELRPVEPEQGSIVYIKWMKSCDTGFCGGHG